MSAAIRNCEFRFKCPKTWDSLTPTDDERVRYCGECERSVHYCRTQSELHAAIVDDLCVAVEIRIRRKRKDPDIELTVGHAGLPPYEV